MKKKDTLKRGNILLEAGTNEVEIIEFIIDGCAYGINVAKVQSIILYPDNIMAIPESHPALLGIINLRGNVITVINLAKYLGKTEILDMDKSRVIVCNFNNIIVGFAVDEVTRIHRMSWDQIEVPSSFFSLEDNVVVAVAKLKEAIILLLDFEKITSDINPECGIQQSETIDYHAEEVKFNRADKTIFVAEDSVFIRKMLLDYLNTSGYKSVYFNNGQEAWDKLRELSASGKIEDYVSLFISDIEMPQMDGLHLIQNIKNDSKLQHLPCVVFSSLITDEVAHKCESVGADAQISKPEIAGLIDLVDKYVLK